MPGSAEAFITGGGEGCAPSMLVWGIAIVCAMLLLGAMGKVDLVALGKKLGGSEGYYRGANALMSQMRQDNISVAGRENFDFGDIWDPVESAGTYAYNKLKVPVKSAGTYAYNKLKVPAESVGTYAYNKLEGFRGRENNEFDDILDAAAKAGADPLPEGDGAAAAAGMFAGYDYTEGGYRDYRGGEFQSVDRDPVDEAAAKALAAANSERAVEDLWARFGGENACDLPVSAVALAEAMSLVAANGDVPCGGAAFAADLGATPDQTKV